MSGDHSKFCRVALHTPPRWIAKVERSPGVTRFQVINCAYFCVSPKPSFELSPPRTDKFHRKCKRKPKFQQSPKNAFRDPKCSLELTEPRTINSQLDPEGTRDNLRNLSTSRLKLSEPRTVHAIEFDITGNECDNYE